MVKYGEVPDALKTAIVTPIYKKKGNKKETKNYRPIWILPTTTTIIDTIVYGKLITHFEVNNLLMVEQHGYWRNRSTKSVITILTDHIKMPRIKRKSREQYSLTLLKRSKKLTIKY